MCQLYIKESLYLCKRYEILTQQNPHHESSTSLVHLAIDHSNNDERVALKFIKNKNHYSREFSVRQKTSFESKYIMSVIAYYDGDEDEFYQQEICKHKLGTMKLFVAMITDVTFVSYVGKFRYCIVMPAAGKSLHMIMNTEHIAGMCPHH
jgi:serine/threonine protein kinase